MRRNVVGAVLAIAGFAGLGLAHPAGAQSAPPRKMVIFEFFERMA